MRKKVFFIVFLLAIAPQAIHAEYKAVVTVPIADLVSEPFGLIHKNKKSIAQRYQTLPENGDSSNPFSACPRMHQALFNEQVTVHKEKGDEVCIKTHNTFYQTAKDNTKHSLYWTHKKNITPLKTLTQHDINLAALPSPIQFTDPNSVLNDKVITLIEPWYDATTHTTYSVGTRFVLKSSRKNHYAVYRLNTQHMRIEEMSIPRQYAFSTHAGGRSQKIQQMVYLLKRWAHQENGFIPYVWGGSSFTAACTNPFSHKKVWLCDELSDYCYTHENECSPKGGFDCSGAVSRAAQICEIPYFCKNTTAITKQLQPIGLGTIESGDLIWIPGHVMVVSDVHENTLIEARGYPSGHGKLHETPLNKVFGDINTYTDLCAVARKKKPLKKLKADGTVEAHLPYCEIYKLSSVWRR